MLALGRELVALAPEQLGALLGGAADDEELEVLEAAIAEAERDAGIADARDHAPLGQATVFRRLGYQPNCLRRHQAAEAGRVVAACGQCPQELYHSATEFDVLYGGAAGGGKSKALVMGALADAMSVPGIRVGAFRRSFPELEESLLRELAAVGFAEELGAAWNGTKHELRFPNGSVIRFGHLQTTKDASRRQGGEYQRLVIDERQQIDPGVVALLEERLRSGRADVPVLGLRSGSNPGDIGHGALKTRYVEPTSYGRQVAADAAGRSVRFIPARFTDNPHLDDGYVAVLNSIPDPARRAAMRDGSWDVFAGQFFATWRRDRHVVEPFALPGEWERRAGIDYGYAAPWCVLWGGIDGDGRVWVYREIYERGVGQTVQAGRIVAAETVAGDRLHSRAADPSMWAKVGEANSNAQIYEGAGCSIHKAVNDRVSGWARVQHYLDEMPACDLHRAAPFGWETCPRLHVFTNCANLTRTLPSLPRDQRRVEDLDSNSEDHAADALRYLLMSIRDSSPVVAPVGIPRSDAGGFGEDGGSANPMWVGR